MKSKQIEEYFSTIEGGVDLAYDFANKARIKGYDPSDEVEISRARNVAERVVGLISIVAPGIKNVGIIERIAELEKEYEVQDWRVAYKIAEEVAQEKFCKFKNKVEAIEVGLRIGLAYITNGVVSSPLEGFVRLELKKRKDGKEYFTLFFSGPIRSAGTTATCAFVALSDYVRKSLGYSLYDPTKEEIKRCSTEINYFHERITNLQYLPSNEELEYLTEHLPMQIDGDPSEVLDVPNYKDLSRVATNKLRNGYCLVMAECISQKGKKFWGQFSKWYKDFGMDHWNFMEEFIDLQKKKRAGGEVKKEGKGISPDYNYIKDLVAGRPILGYPLRNGGFRLRYGRSRVSGLSSMSMHPSTMHLLNNYIGTGTQLRYERPGKSSAMAACDTIEGPIVKLKNGNVLLLEDEETAKKVSKNVEEILYLGDMLVNFGEFLNRAHVLVPPGYCEEWWMQELKSKGFKSEKMIPFDQAYEISKKYDIPLHPRYTFYWASIQPKQVLSLIDWLAHAVIKEDKIIFPLIYNIEKDIIDVDPKRALELLGVPHLVINHEFVVVEDDWAKSLLCSFGSYKSNFNVDSILKKFDNTKQSLEIINLISDVKMRDKCGFYIGARMGRPEKAKLRKMIGSPHMLFPVGSEGGRFRSLQSAIEKGAVTAQFSVYLCDSCKKETIYRVCECGERTRELFFCKLCGRKEEACIHNPVIYEEKSININDYVKSARQVLSLENMPDLIKGVKGTSNKNHIPENLAKGMLRAKNDLFVNKDGTIRYDMTEMPMTAFYPREIGTKIEKLRELGYGKDINGNDLVSENQLIELKPADIVLPASEESLNEGADKVLYRIGLFIDELLNKFYKMDCYYNLKDKDDLIGHLVIGLAPHISAGIVGRIIGFSKTQCCFAHPLWHSACRRDCEGDELCVILLMDALLNFSKSFLPAHRGATQDAPLVLTSTLIASEVDEMVFDMDVVWEYPLEFYEACLNYKNPREVHIEVLGDRLGKEGQYEGMGFTHDVSDINKGVRCSAYKLLPTMEEKLNGQMNIAEKIRAVDENDVARLVIERHFIRDIRGNLRKFSMQEFRCVKCNNKFRRPPLAGVCDCGGRIIFTISEGSITKYMGFCMELAKKYDLPSYLRQTIDLTRQRIELVFGKDLEKQEGLGKWF